MSPVVTGPTLTNRTFDQIAVGETASLSRLVSQDDIEIFAAETGDVNPAHLDAAYASTDVFGHVVIHGMWTAGLISTLLGTALPGPGTIYLGQTLRFLRPVAPGDTVTATVTVKEKKDSKHIVVLDTRCANQKGEEVLTGEATVMAPLTALTLPRMPRPRVVLSGVER